MRLKKRTGHCIAPAVLLLAVVCGGCATPPKGQPDALSERPGEGRVERLARLRDAAADNPDNARTQYELANALFDLGIYTEAMQRYRRAIELDPGFPDAYANLGLTLRRAGRAGEAIQAYERALAIHPDDPVTLRNALIAAQALQDTERVLDYTRRLVELEPDNTELEADLAGLYLRLRRFEEARTLYARRVKAGRASPEDYLGLGQAHFYLEHWEKAEQAWNAGLDMDPNHGPMQRGLAVLYWTTGRYAAAWEQVRVCQQLGVPLDPEFIAALAEDSGQSPPGESADAPHVGMP
mgnify:CR=1 FL=1